MLATPVAYVAHFVFLRDVWMRTQRAAVASRRATNLATHLFRLFLCYKILYFLRLLKKAGLLFIFSLHKLMPNVERLKHDFLYKL